MPPVHRDGQVGTEGHPDASNATTTLKITRSPVRDRRQRAPIALASVFGPVGRRRTWWYTYRCRICGAYLFGRAKTLDAVTGERKAGCGHRVQIMAARIYSQPESGAAA
jgi:hypothetical protein